MSKLVSLLLLSLLVGCHHHTLHAPSDFVVLEESPPYATRAVSAQGVVIGVREIDNDPRANAAFWLSAVRTQLLEGRGYALLAAKDVRASSGQPGKQLRLGREQNGEQYLYWLTVFVTKQRLYLVEAGARRDRFEEAQPEIERSLASLTLKGTAY